MKACTYLQSCAGGIFEGDDLRLRIEAGEGTSAHVTSGASTIVHSMEQEAAAQCLEIRAREGAFLEYLPDPSILFPRARLDNRVQIIVHPGSTVIAGDSLLLHDPKGGGMFDWQRSETRISNPRENSRPATASASRAARWRAWPEPRPPRAACSS